MDEEPKLGTVSKEEKWLKVASHNDQEIKGFFGKFRFLSNFWPAKVYLDGEEYSSVENAYQAAKYGKEVRVMFGTFSPEEAVTYAKENLLDEEALKEWNIRKLEVMRKLLVQKYDKELNPDNYEKLKGTDVKYLEETNYWGDSYWGVSKTESSEEGIGENNLGKLLMEIRATLN